MSAGSLSEEIRKTWARLAELRQGESAATADRLPQALHELQNTLEELQTVGDELHRQNEELTETRLALEAQHRHYRELFELAPEAYLETDAEGVIREANRAAAALLRVPMQFLCGKPMSVFVAEQERRSFRVWLVRLQKLERIQDWECLFQPRDGDPFTASVTATALSDPNGQALVLRWLLHDVSERKRADTLLRQAREELELRVEQRTAELQKANAALTAEMAERQRAEQERLHLHEQLLHAQKLESLVALAGGVAHDFNNLLVSVLGNVELALEEAGGAPVQQYLQRIETAAQRAADLTRQMLAYSGRGRFVVQPVQLSMLVMETARLLETVVAQRAAVVYQLAQQLPSIEADATQLRQVLLNLVTNSVEALGEQTGVITIGTGVVQLDAADLARSRLGDRLGPGTYVSLEVSDNGCGMSAETQAKIFDPFFSTKFAGRGLGLAAVLGIVRGHGGAIQVKSELGAGTSFRVLLCCSQGALDPVAGRSPSSPVPEPLVPASGRSRASILVVDDEKLVRDVARKMLEKFGFEVHTAEDGLDAVERFREAPDSFDLVLLDLTMPRMGGEQAFRELRRIRPQVRVVFSSGFTEQDAARRFAEEDLPPFLQKPYGPAKLIETVRQVLGL